MLADQQISKIQRSREPAHPATAPPTCDQHLDVGLIHIGAFNDLLYPVHHPLLEPIGQPALQEATRQIELRLRQRQAALVNTQLQGCACQQRCRLGRQAAAPMRCMLWCL